MPDVTGLPALRGGKPVSKEVLPYGRQRIDEADIRAVVDVLRSDWLTTGPKVEQFEEIFATCVGARHAVSFSSGTGALHAAAFAAGLSPGDEAITSPLTFCATANCILYQGAMPIFADVSPETLTIDPGQIASRITSHTRAILPVDYAGHPSDLGPILKLAQDHELVVIEDASHALGAEYQGERVGAKCHMTTFSFHPVKHITTGEGGMVTTQDEKLAARLKMFRNHGIDSDARQRMAEGQWYYEMMFLGYNYRLSDIACALGLSQLQKLDANLARRREIAARYTKAFENFPAINTPKAKADVNAAWHLYPIRLKLDRLSVDRKEIFQALRAENLGVNVHYIPVPLHPYYAHRFGYRAGDFPVAEAAYERLISLPMFHGMSDDDIQAVVDGVSKVVHYYAA